MAAMTLNFKDPGELTSDKLVTVVSTHATIVSYRGLVTFAVVKARFVTASVQDQKL